MTEGRARFLKAFAEIDSGAACERWAPVLSAIVDGEATPDQFNAVRPHLRHCGACRATLRSLYEAQPALHALLPVAAVAAVGGSGWMESLVGAFGDRIAKAQSVVEAVSSSKAAAVMASTAVVATGGASAAEKPVEKAHVAKPHGRPVPDVAERPLRRAVVARVVGTPAPALRARPAVAREEEAPREVVKPRQEFAFEARSTPRPALRPAAEHPAHAASTIHVPPRRGADFGFERQRLSR